MPLYPNPPAARIPYGIDGSIVYTVIGGVYTQLSGADAAALNDEDKDATTYTLGVGDYIGVLFPIKYAGVWHALFGVGTGAAIAWDTSPDSTDGTNGTWTSWGSETLNADLSSTPPDPNYRNANTGGSATATYGVRFRVTAGSVVVSGLHLFHSNSYATDDSSNGAFNVAARSTLGHLEFNAAGDVSGDEVNFGDVFQGSTSVTKTFQLTNKSGVRTANSIALSLEAPTDTTPSVLNGVSFRVNGGSWVTTATIASLAPTASATIDVRHVVPSNAKKGPWAFRVKAVVGSWS